MTVTATSFKIRFPEFTSIADARIDLFLADAVNKLNEAHWGNIYDLGVNYFTAHTLAIAVKSEAAGGSGAGGGRISSRNVDGSGVGYDTRTADSSLEDYYNQTSYGMRYWAEMQSLPIAAASI